MSFVPVTGPARLLAGEPPREGSVEFTDERRTLVMPIRGALPVLGKVRDQADVHPSVALLAALADRGWSADDLARLTCRNVLRVMREVEDVSRDLRQRRGPSLARLEDLDGVRA